MLPIILLLNCWSVDDKNQIHCVLNYLFLILIFLTSRVKVRNKVNKTFCYFVILPLPHVLIFTEWEKNHEAATSSITPFVIHTKETYCCLCIIIYFVLIPWKTFINRELNHLLHGVTAVLIIGISQGIGSSKKECVHISRQKQIDH